MIIGKEFNQIVSKEVLDKISHAMTNLYSELIYTNPEEAKEIVQELVEGSKKVVDCYMDEQKTTLLKLIDLT